MDYSCETHLYMRFVFPFPGVSSHESVLPSVLWHELHGFFMDPYGNSWIIHARNICICVSYSRFRLCHRMNLYFQMCRGMNFMDSSWILTILHGLFMREAFVYAFRHPEPLDYNSIPLFAKNKSENHVYIYIYLYDPCTFENQTSNIENDNISQRNSCIIYTQCVVT